MPHIHDEYDFIVSIFIVCDDQVLFANHKRYDKWVPIGGHVELDEDPEETVFREVHEETNLDIKLLGARPEFDVAGVKSLTSPAFMNVHEANPPHKHISLIYFAVATTGNFKLSDEHTELRWISGSALDDREYELSESLKIYARAAIVAAKKSTES